jgi:hypothetical protein
MPRAKRSIEGEVAIDGFPLIWHLHREEQRISAEEWRGISVHVKVAEMTRRELFLEYPSALPQKPGWIRTEPPRPAVTAAKVEKHIREAMAVGWNPESRGKPFVYQVSELPS